MFISKHRRHLSSRNTEHPKILTRFESSSSGTSLGLEYKQPEIYSQGKFLYRSDEQ